ncbi:thioester-containing protein 1 allele R1-like [Musca autumnalis]|uniref:thioester-containing protein 1 allele R1-like n=1 Tax=Musca autumnalis TaxID=221902 RepID=UPI003CF9028A
MKQLICFISIVLYTLVGVRANGYYTIVAPGTIQSGSEYTVTVAVHDTYETARINVAIVGPSYNETKTIEVPSYGTEMVHFDIPKLEKGTYELHTEGVKGLIFKRNSELIFKPHIFNVYIQTDKAMYKPGDEVKYRIIALDDSAKPAKIFDPLTLMIYDSEGNRIKKIQNLKFTKGVYSGKFELSEESMLGKWSIDILDGSEQHVSSSVAAPYHSFTGYTARNIQLVPTPKARKNFEVAKYVLPKFSVTIESDKQVAVLDRSFKVTIRSKYVHGRMVNGNVSVTAYFDDRESHRLPKAEKHMELTNGKAEMEFSFMEDIVMDHLKHELKLLAIVSEQHTGLQQNTTASIKLEAARYTIEVPKMQDSYEINKPFEIKAYIKKLNGLPVTNARSSAKLILKRYRGCESDGLMFEADIDKNGVAIFNLKFTLPARYENVVVMYEEKKHNVGVITIVDPQEKTTTIEQPGHPYRPRTPAPSTHKPPVGPLKISPRNNKPKLGEEIILDIESDDPIPYFFYTIMSRGKIVRHEYVKVGDNKKQYELKIQPTFEMAPKAKIFAYLIDDGEMKSYTVTLNVPGTFQNKLVITGPPAANVSDEITLNIETEPDSFVGLLAIDQSVLLLKSGNDLNGKEIYNNLDKFQSSSPETNGRHSTYPGKDGGFLTITNGCYPRHDDIHRSYAYGPGYIDAVPQYSLPRNVAQYGAAMPIGGAMESIEPVIRKNFEETWIYDDIESTGATGSAKFSKTLPDTLTSWVISGFSINENKGFGITEHPINISVSQPFFVAISLPYSMKRGEILTVPVLVFNNMAHDVMAKITLENNNEEFNFADAEGNMLTEQHMSQEVEVKSNSDATVEFKIYPRILGEITLTIKAITPLAGDAVQHKLKVEPEGVRETKNEAMFLNLKSKEEQFKYTFETAIPSDVVKDSEYFELTAVSDILGPALESLEKMVYMPSGGGSEQNVKEFTINFMLLQYLEAMKADKPELKEKAIRFMETAYQRQLSYKTPKGGFYQFHRYYYYSEPNVRLTSKVARSFIMAQKYITIDKQIIDKALDYLAGLQTINGDFSQTGEYQHESQDTVVTTAHVMLAFLEDMDYRQKYRSQISKGIEYLKRSINNVHDAYAMAITSLVFRRANQPALAKLLERFDQLWELWPVAVSGHYSNDVEILAYFLETLLEAPEVPAVDDTKLLAIIKYIVSKRNSRGGYLSTQDTVVALEALIKFAEKYNIGAKGKMDITFEARNSADEVISSNSLSVESTDGAFSLKSFMLPKTTRKLMVSAVGEGSGLLQFAYHYNVLNQAENNGYHLTYELKTPSASDFMTMNVCAEYKADFDDKIGESNMSVMEIFLPSGYKTHENAFENLLHMEAVQNVESRNDNTQIVIYLDSLPTDKPLCFDIYAEKYHYVEKLQSAAMLIYDYYEPKKRTLIFYNIMK